MSLAKRIAGDMAAICTAFLTWALLAPVVAGPIKPPVVQHTCPAPRTVHGVSANLKSYEHRVDGCSITSR